MKSKKWAPPQQSGDPSVSQALVLRELLPKQLPARGWGGGVDSVPATPGAPCHGHHAPARRRSEEATRPPLPHLWVAPLHTRPDLARLQQR